MTCRHCGEECEPNRGPGYRDECPAHAGMREVERMVAGFAADVTGVEWEPIPRRERARLLRVEGHKEGWGWESDVGRRLTCGLRQMQVVGSGQ